MKYPLLAQEHPLNLEQGTDDASLITNYQGRRPKEGPCPVWFMRQAGRSLPEYRAAREGTTILDACLKPAIASEITLQPVRRHHVDGAIFFSDIMVPIKIAGLEVDIVRGVGPVVGEPLRSAADIARLPVGAEVFTDENFAPITEAIHRINRELLKPERPPIPLIGFAGAPFTVAAYLVEGRPSRDHLAARELMLSDTKAWNALMQWVTDSSIAFLKAQIKAGASAVQLFDSWAKSLSYENYSRHAEPFSAQIFSALGELGVPKVHFGAPYPVFLQTVRRSGADVIGINEQASLTHAAKALNWEVPLQGNIDPAVLAAPWKVIEKHVRAIVEEGRPLPGHVVNLGHGVPPATDPRVLTRIVELIHSI